MFVGYTSLGIPSNPSERSGFSFFLYTYFIFNYVYKMGVRGMFMWLQVPTESREIWFLWRWSYRWLWAAHSRFWELNSVPTQEQYTVLNHWLSHLSPASWFFKVPFNHDFLKILKTRCYNFLLSKNILNGQHYCSLWKQRQSFFSPLITSYKTKTPGW